jgi:sigma-B regulation protein RsbU (phosphoserine phosphatase)
MALHGGDLFVFCSDGVFEANDALGREFGAKNLQETIAHSCHKSARELVDDIFGAVAEFRGETAPNDDMTAVAVKILT